MDTFLPMLGIVLLFAALLIPGYILGKARAITDASAISFSNILMYIAMPFLVFSKLLEIDLSTVGLTEILISVFLPIVLELILLVVCRLVFNKKEARGRAATFCSIFPNCGFLGIPLAATMWPDKPEIVLYISIFNVISTFLLLTLGVYVLSGDKKAISLKKALISPIFFAIVLGIIASFLNLNGHWSYVGTYAVTLAQLTTPLAMISLGYELSKLDLLKMWINGCVYLTAFIKLIISPLVAISILVLIKYVFGMEIDFSIVSSMLVATAVSTAASAPSMAKKYDADAEYTATLTLANTLLCIVTLPLAYMLLEVGF
ncbi:MAG: AEC family transporter [Clostridia bacterium]|nr:AEC family transporter [Clostridia bacterium]